MKYTVTPQEALQRDDVGGKAAALARLHTAGFLIPPWFVVLPVAAEDSKQMRPTAQDTSLLPSAGVAQEITRALPTVLNATGLVAVRSSAAFEDGAKSSFAGQFESYLCVAQSQVNARVASLWQSAQSARIHRYRQEQGLELATRPPAVIVQQMLNPSASGVAFTADPVSGRTDVCVVNAVYGLGHALVSGAALGDSWRVNEAGTIGRRDLVAKPTAYFAKAGGGLEEHSVAAQTVHAPSLTDTQIQEVAALARRAAAYFGSPQDIEWAWQDDQLFLLQSRPITALRKPSSHEGRLRLWDNSNIIESYCGVTTPLTFSFIRRAYEEVYRQFCRVMSVPRSVIARHDDVFGQMLGLIQGRVYYNLLSWYRVLAMLPGFKLNRKFMEQMMGVKEPLPEELLQEVEQLTANQTGNQSASIPSRFGDAARLGVTLLGLVKNHFGLPKLQSAWRRRLDTALAPPEPPLPRMRADQLVAYYRSLERQLLRQWDAPIVNDFFAMIFFGILRRLTAKWKNDQSGSLANELVRCGQGMISVEPLQRIRSLASLARKHPDPGFVDLLAEGSSEQILAAGAAFPPFAEASRDYLATFGCRCFAELKLESLTLQEDSLILWRTVAAAAQDSSPRSPNANLPPAMEDETLASLQRAVFSWVLNQARHRVRDRENLRFARTQLFARVRQVFLQLGERFAEMGRINNARDIFYLEVEEALGVVEGTASTANLRELIALRQEEFARYSASIPPPNRFTTRGAVEAETAFIPTASATNRRSDIERQGIACSPGRRRGLARVVTDPAQNLVKPGEILVAAQTDPGWILLFNNAAGLVVERGSLLSHSAIVAREMHLPAVVGLDGATTWVHTGERIEIDGSLGTVRKLP